MEGIIISKTDKPQRFAEEQVVRSDGTIRKASSVQAFVIPDDIEHKMATVDLFYGIKSFIEDEETVYEGWCVREKFTFDILKSATEILADLHTYWNTNYKPLDDAIDGLLDLNSFEF